MARVEVKGTWQLNVMHDPSFDPGLKKVSVKNMIETNGDRLS